MLINFYRKFLLLLFTTLIYCNLFILVNYTVFVNIYPYLLCLTVLFMLFLLILQFFQNTFVIKTIYIIMSIFFIFFIFTFSKIYKNTRILNSYDKNKQNTHIPVSLYNEALLIYDDTVMFDEIIEEISKAKNHIHIEFFILRNDNIGKKLKDLLIKKANEGVEVRIIYDGLGSLSIKKNYRSELKAAGAQIKAYDNIFESIIKGKLNNRNHRKIVIVDGIVGFTGGINIGDEYLGRDNSIGNWKDILIKIKGEAVNDMQMVFLDDWNYVSGEKLMDNKYFPKWEGTNVLPIQIVAGKYDTSWNEINRTYFSIITSAKEKLYIATPYLVLSDSMINALQDAALNGVDVKIIIPQNPDLFLVGWANSSFFNKLLNSNIKIYLYKNGFLHSKVFVADNNILSVGSANFNTRSLYLDYEMNAILFDQNQSDMMIKELYKNINDSEEVTLEDYNKWPLIERFKEKIGMLARPLI